MASRRKASRVTLATVAERANVSITTVSLILSGRADRLAQFHPDTIAKVRRSAERLGYRANLVASGLPTNSSSLFAVILHDRIEDDLGTWHHWAFEGSLLIGIIEAATRERRHPVVATAERAPGEDEIAEIARMVEGGVFGTIARTPGPRLEHLLRRQLQQGRPVIVVFPRRLSDWTTNAIDVDNVAMGETAAELLARRRRKRWLVVSYRQTRESLRLRCQGFRKLAGREGTRVQTLRLPLDVDEARVGELVVPRLRRWRPDGVFGLDSVSSVGSLMALVESGMTPGQDCDFVGCDCSMWHSPYLPRITSLDICWRRVGAWAIRELVKLAHADDCRPKTVLLKPRIIAGGTCPVPADFKPEPPEGYLP